MEGLKEQNFGQSQDLPDERGARSYDSSRSRSRCPSRAHTVDHAMVGDGELRARFKGENGENG